MRMASTNIDTAIDEFDSTIPWPDVKKQVIYHAKYYIRQYTIEGCRPYYDNKDHTLGCTRANNLIIEFQSLNPTSSEDRRQMCVFACAIALYSTSSELRRLLYQSFWFIKPEEAYKYAAYKFKYSDNPLFNMSETRLLFRTIMLAKKISAKECKAAIKNLERHTDPWETFTPRLPYNIVITPWEYIHALSNFVPIPTAHPFFKYRRINYICRQRDSDLRLIDFYFKNNQITLELFYKYGHEELHQALLKLFSNYADFQSVATSACIYGEWEGARYRNEHANRIYMTINVNQLARVLNQLESIQGDFSFVKNEMLDLLQLPKEPAPEQSLSQVATESTTALLTMLPENPTLSADQEDEWAYYAGFFNQPPIKTDETKKDSLDEFFNWIDNLSASKHTKTSKQESSSDQNDIDRFFETSSAAMAIPPVLPTKEVSRVVTPDTLFKSNAEIEDLRKILNALPVPAGLISKPKKVIADNETKKDYSSLCPA